MFDTDLDLVNLIFKTQLISNQKYNEISDYSKKSIDKLKNI
jgi:hypothetical protein